MLSGMAGLGMVQQNPLGSLFGSIVTNAMAGLSGLGAASLQSENSGNDLLPLAALLGGSQQQNVTFQPAQLLQIRLQQQQATQVAAPQEEITKRIEAAATTRSAERLKIEHENQKQKKQKTRTRRSKMRMTQPHEARRMDGHRVLGNERLLQKPTLKSRRWKWSVTSPGRPSVSLRPI